MNRSIHPFPARMAPELAVNELQNFPAGTCVLDPMVGSGTVIKKAKELGHRSIGFDLDPLAVLISKINTINVNIQDFDAFGDRVLNEIEQIRGDLILPWIDNDEETTQYINFWFGERQIADLRKIAYKLYQYTNDENDNQDIVNYINILRVALSRIIITKKEGASLAWDVSHSRPHRVYSDTNFQVMNEFRKSIATVKKILSNNQDGINPIVDLCDARNMMTIGDSSIDVIVTSPPYLNAIDYMRGHRLSLVWLGYSISALREIRSTSIGTERGYQETQFPEFTQQIYDSIVDNRLFTEKYQKIIMRYATDLNLLFREFSRVVRHNGHVIVVIGNSCINDMVVNNSQGIISAAANMGLNLEHQYEREILLQNRYLPLPNNGSQLGKRMRTEKILNFIHNN